MMHDRAKYLVTFPPERHEFESKERALEFWESKGPYWHLYELTPRLGDGSSFYKQIR